MGKKAGGKKKKAAAAEDPDKDLDPDLKDLPLPSLQDRMTLFNDRFIKISKDRNYMQLEKDMVNRFYEITKQEVRQVDAELLDMDRQMELLLRDHRVHIKVHEQRVQTLEYEHKESRRQVKDAGETGIQEERDDHAERVREMSRKKLEIKRELREDKGNNQGNVDMMCKANTKNLQNLRKTFEANHQKLQEQYDQQVEELKVALELRRKVEIHEIEERKNQHINELLFNHQEAFDEIKGYYNEITYDNLQLIKNLKDEIVEMKEKDKNNQKRIQTLTQECKDLSEPLAKKREEQRELEDRLKTYTKDKMALKNLRAHHKKLEERTTEAKTEYRGTEDRYRKLEKEKDDMRRQFEKVVKENQRKAELGKNAVLEKKLEQLTAQYDEKQAQLTEVLTEAKLDPTIVANVTKKLEQVVGAKNRQIKDLQYQVHQATKVYNDTIRVYETTLPALGIDQDELGFEEIQTATSKMPARLVTRVR